MEANRINKLNVVPESGQREIQDEDSEAGDE